MKKRHIPTNNQNDTLQQTANKTYSNRRPTKQVLTNAPSPPSVSHRHALTKSLPLVRFAVAYGSPFPHIRAYNFCNKICSKNKPEKTRQQRKAPESLGRVSLFHLPSDVADKRAVRVCEVD